VVVKIDNAPVEDADDLVRAVGRLVPGQVALFTVLREDRRMVVPVQLGQRPSKPRTKC
jgi:S1-C subfamily serine protease